MSARLRAGGFQSLAACLVLLLGAFSARGEEAAPPVIGGQGARIAPPTGYRSVASDESRASSSHSTNLEHRSILLDLSALHPPPTFDDSALVAEIAPEVESPGSVVRTYEGVESILVRRVMGYYRRLFTEDIHERWRRGNDTMFSLERRRLSMACADADLQAGGRWWERTWRQSLTPQMGGAPANARIEQIGNEIEIFRLGEIALTNEGKLKVGRLSLYLDDDRIYERLEQRTRDAFFSSRAARAEANLARVVSSEKEKEKGERPQKVLVSGEDHLDVSVALLEDDAALDLERVLAGTTRERTRRGGRFQTPRGNVATFEGWNVSLRPNLQLRLPDGRGFESAISRAELVLDFRLYPGETRQLWGIVTFKVSASPRDNMDVTGQVNLEIVRW